MTLHTSAPVESPSLQTLLVCPKCRASLEAPSADRWICRSCGGEFAVVDGIPQLALLDEKAADIDPAGRQTAASYQRNYQELEPAVDYNEAYKRFLLKRWSSRREFQLLHRLLGSQPRCRTLLDLPCGGGRLSATIAEYTDWLIEADIGLGQIYYGQKQSQTATPRSWLTASAYHIPLRDKAVDGVVCVRLCHHLPTPEERERLVAELLRVASRFVVMTFFDYHSLKNYLRRARRPFNRKPPKNTMSVSEVRTLAATHGAQLVACPTLSWIGSGHRYGLMVKS